MILINFKTILYTIILVSTVVNAWEVNTHRAIDRCALSDECGGQRSTNLHQFVQDTDIVQDNYQTEVFEGYSTQNGAPVTYFDYATSGESYGISKWTQSFNNRYDYQSLIEAGIFRVR